MLKSQALERRGSLLVRLEQLAQGERPSRRDSLDLVMGVIEDAHAAEPVLFGPDAARHFARLHAMRRDLDG